MRHVSLTLAGCMAVLLLGIGLLFVYDHAGHELTLPDAVMSGSTATPSRGGNRSCTTFRQTEPLTTCICN